MVHLAGINCMADGLNLQAFLGEPLAGDPVDSLEFRMRLAQQTFVEEFSECSVEAVPLALIIEVDWDQKKIVRLKLFKQLRCPIISCNQLAELAVEASAGRGVYKKVELFLG
ncbi:hypothetical protein D9M69_570920 [compost metagenome]